MRRLAPSKSVSVGDWLSEAEDYLASHGVSEASANAKFLMAAVLKIGRADVTLQRGHHLPSSRGRHFWNMVEERGRRVPLSYVLGSQPFMGLELEVTSSVLIPRPETEETVAAAIALLRERSVGPRNLLEIGTGSGCIALALSAAFPDATVYATDLSPAALRLALKNAEANHLSRRVRFIQEDLFKPGTRPQGEMDLLISNPPYIPSGELKNLPEEVRKEPFLALDGGLDGLKAIRAIIALAPGLLKPDGLLVLEIGSGQANAVSRLLEAAGFYGSVRKDMQGHDRVAIGLRSK